MKKILISILLLCSFMIAKSATYYIDPSNSEAIRTGSYYSPFNSWSEIPWASNNTYLIKSSSVLTASGFQVTTNLNNVTISSYGSATKPVILCSATNTSAKALSFTGITDSLTIQNLEISSTTGNIASLVSFTNANTNLSLINLKIHGAAFGIRVRSNSTAPNDFTSNLSIIQCEVFNTKDDGIYPYKIHGLLIDYVQVYKSNQFWAPGVNQKIAAGDNVQLTLVDNPTIRNSSFKRNDTGNKNCILVAGTNNVTPNVWLLENNDFYGPIATNQGGAALYFGDIPDSVNIEFNFNYVIGTGSQSLAGVWFDDDGDFYSTGNVYRDLIRAISKRSSSSYIESSNDEFTRCGNPSTGVVILD